METPVMYTIGLIIILILCAMRGYKRWNRKHDGEMSFTLECGECNGVDFSEREDYFICRDCGTKTRK